MNRRREPNQIPWMTPEGICKEYRTAKSPKEAVGILAELNNCSKKAIVDILIAGGEKVDKRWGGVSRSRTEETRVVEAPVPIDPSYIEHTYCEEEPRDTDERPQAPCKRATDAPRTRDADCHDQRCGAGLAMTEGTRASALGESLCHGPAGLAMTEEAGRQEQGTGDAEDGAEASGDASLRGRGITAGQLLRLLEEIPGDAVLLAEGKAITGLRLTMVYSVNGMDGSQLELVTGDLSGRANLDRSYDWRSRDDIFLCDNAKE